MMIDFPDLSFKPFQLEAILEIVVLILLLFGSALMSAAEAAYFSLKPIQLKNIKESNSKRDHLVLKLLEKPDKLLANILIGNNFVNITIIILSTYVSSALIDFSAAPLFGFIIQVVVITFIIILICEIIPKIFATEHAIQVSRVMAQPIHFMSSIFFPLTALLLQSTSIVQKRLGTIKPNLSIDDLSNALELTGEALNEEKKILRGIVKFGNTSVSEIMHPRIDIIGIEISASLSQLLSIVVESGYSRLPVYDGTPDNIKGILLAKDLLPYINENNTFHWQGLIKPAYFVPETKKIDDLLAEFQKNKIHLAVVIDEYGGTSGLITMEDILEEVIGEISDESDIEEELPFKKLSENVYLFEAKVQLNDFFKIIGAEDTAFDDLKGEYETLAGLVLELKGEIPQKGDRLEYKNFVFQVEAADKRRIKQIKVTIK